MAFIKSWQISEVFTVLTTVILLPGNVSMVAVSVALGAMIIFALVGLVKFVVHILP